MIVVPYREPEIGYGSLRCEMKHGHLDKGENGSSSSKSTVAYTFWEELAEGFLSKFTSGVISTLSAAMPLCW